MNETDRAERYKLSEKTIHSDLTDDLPLYILSAYGPGRDVPRQLFEGHPREQSFEELRVRHYELAAQGKQQQAIHESQLLVDDARQQIRNVLSDINGAIKYLCDGENQHPNRIDFCRGKGPSNAPLSLTTSMNSNSVQQPNSSFGQPSAAPIFGVPTTTPAFGRPSVSPIPASSTGPAFGQVSGPSTTFGQPSVPTFRQPSSQTGQHAAGAFGTSATVNVFGQAPSHLDQTSNPRSSFGQLSGQSAPNVNQQPSNFASATPNPFGQPQSTAQPANSVFGNSSSSNTANPFGQSTSTGFGQQATKPVQPQPNPFATSTTPTAQHDTQMSSINPTRSLGENPAVSQIQTISQGQQSTPTTSAQAANAAVFRRPHAAMGAGQTQKNAQGDLTTWNGKAVRYIDEQPCYRDDRDGEWHRIWFPNGQPVFTKTVDLDLEAYDNATKENYEFTKANGTFKAGIMPLLPPRKEWCNWNI